MSVEENMDQLIKSIREQTIILKVLTTQKNLSESMRDRVALKRTPQTSPRDLSRLGCHSPQETLMLDLTTSKQQIESLVQDNKQLHEDLDNCKTVLHLMSNKYKEVKRDLELQRIKNSRAPLLEKQISTERETQRRLRLEQVRLKDKFATLFRMLREGAYQTTPEALEDISTLEEFSSQNAALRGLLAYSTISDPKMKEIQREMMEKEETEKNLDEHKETLKKYKAIREEQKRSKSFAASSRKNYLLMGTQEKSSGSGVWDSFFNKHAKKK